MRLFNEIKKQIGYIKNKSKYPFSICFQIYDNLLVVKIYYSKYPFKRRMNIKF